MPGVAYFLAVAASGTTHLADIVTAEMIGGVFNEITGLLPVVIPVSVSFIAIRKGISFLLGMLKKA